ncbi:hemolysin family protein [Thalassovita sp.]|uniref:hemolysin family protein n=1 Tax=Thalassovita sp. TaxID=1979401 RepID=UPI0028821437|nr:hemolysin family protein [Thalassovita sp.]MDF1804270.1 hemolysin family protein [Thalassovita sp.]
MGDSTDGSSTAAQSAQSDDHTESPVKSGFFRRVIGALSPSDVGDPTPENAAALSGSSDGYVPLDISSLRRMRVEDVAIPKADIVSVPDLITKEDLVQVFRKTGLSRLPVYTGTLDTPIGMLHLKDFALKHGFNGDSTAELDVSTLLRPLLYVPPSMPIGVLLQKMQTERRHMALVIDEYGGVDGLVTIEDLIEQIIGEIEDEHDSEEAVFWMEESPGQYLAQAKSPLDEFEAEIGMSLTDVDEVDEEEIDTLGGLVFMLSGRVPVRGEVVKHPDGPEFTVVDADPRRIKRLRVRVPDRAAD